MSGGALAGVLVLVFFVAGIVVGVVVVIAMSARRAREPGAPDLTQDEDDDWEEDDWEEDDEQPDGAPGAWPPNVGWPS